MTQPFYGNEQKIYARLQILKELVGEKELGATPSIHLASQLNELGVLCNCLLSDIRKVESYVSKHILRSTSHDT